ncbi:regulator [Streptomonospora alba]|uniref:Regulator n=1 Tax=Streptomonospora alba TaxID=183763 RepID=A0A0C2JAJ3_9ACTN|nr:DUF397 domain-containing protein [Streptomonospora alba]KIH98491.1 regulator [Streptomonospora alba]
MSTRLSAETWRKSSYSGTNADCVECSSAALPSSVAVRDSKHPQAGHLSFSGSEWSAFLTAVKAARL